MRLAGLVLAFLAAIASPKGLAAQSCGVMDPNNVFITFHGPTSLCDQSNNLCFAGEQVTLSVSSNGYDFSCAPHTFTWNIGGTARTITHTFSAQGIPVGSFTPVQIQVTIDNGSQVFTASAVILVAIYCGNEYPFGSVSFRGQQSGCSESGGFCKPGETISFMAVPLWDVSVCPEPAAFWDWGDEAGSSGAITSHTYIAPGTYDVGLFFFVLGGGFAGRGNESPAGSTEVHVGKPAPPPPPGPICNANPIAIASYNLPTARIGQGYSQPLSLTGGKPPYSVLVSDGSLPLGLAIGDGLISGTPLASGTFEFSVRVVDADSCAGIFHLTLTVEPPPRRRVVRH